ncbi:MAG: PilN domain-containing protein [Actinobacteria bacterium]|nr:MAG: PilN domain-containing protein [Actinomycetota bacterium]
MTATVTSANSGLDRTLRIPPISANLLPLEILEARRSRTVRRWVLSGLTVFVVLLGAWYVLANYQTSQAQDSLANAESQAQVLTRQQHAYADVVSTQAQSHAIEAQLSALFADDVRWGPLLGQVQAAAPDGVTIMGMTGTVEQPGQPGAAGATVQAGAAAGNPNRVGTITIAGVGPSKGAVAAYVDALGRIPGLANPYLDSATDQGGRTVQFTLRVDLVKAALGSRFASKSGKGTGGG